MIRLDNSLSKEYADSHYIVSESDPLSWLKATAQTGLTGDKTGSFNLTTTGIVDVGGGDLEIPNGSSPTVDTTGQVAFDTTDKQLIIYDGSAVAVLATQKKFKTYILDTPTATDAFPFDQFPYAITLTKVTGTAKGGTSITFNIEERSATTLNSAGTDTMTSDLAADADGASTTSFSNSSISANAFLVFAGSALSGTVNQVVVMVEYEITRT